MIRCAELGKQNCIDETISRLLESTKPLDIIYSVADKLFNKGKVQESMFFTRL